jgi:hypothetical protein
MRSPMVALIWQIWSRRRTAIWFVIGITLFSGIFNWMFHDIIRDAQADRVSTGFPLVAELLNQHMALATLLLVLSIFNYTEFNPQKVSAGFPHRLFVLPVTSLQLVAVPMVVGAAAAGLISLTWGAWIGRGSRLFPLAFTAYLLLYQGISWTLPGLGAARMLLLGVLAFAFFAVPMILSMRGVPEIYAFGLMAGVGFVSFLGSWIFVARQRSSGGFNRQWAESEVEWLSASSPTHKKPFRSAAAAQFWFEWRRSGLVLPGLVAGLFAVVIAPLSGILQSDAGSSQQILLAALAMPILLALPVGKAFSKPDFWSGDMGVPAVVAVRPLTNSDIVVSKMKVAALSAAISWLVVLVFLSLWLSLWGDVEPITMLRYGLWQIYGQSMFGQYAIAVLSILAGMFLTWRFLVGNLWLGLSGRKLLFSVSALPYAVVPFFGLVALLLLREHEESVIISIRNNLDRMLPQLVWLAALVLIAKLWFAVFSWRKTPSERVRRYLLCWAGASACLVALAILVSKVAWALVPSDMYRMRNLLILGALLVMPLARIGLAQSTLAKNRHRR